MCVGGVWRWVHRKHQYKKQQRKFLSLGKKIRAQNAQVYRGQAWKWSYKTIWELNLEVFNWPEYQSTWHVSRLKWWPIGYQNVIWIKQIWLEESLKFQKLATTLKGLLLPPYPLFRAKWGPNLSCQWYIISMGFGWLMYDFGDWVNAWNDCGFSQSPPASLSVVDRIN